MRVAYIGLGNMGQPMARNILAAGHELQIYNRTRSRAEALEAQGATVAGSPREAAAGAELICICVSTPAVVREMVVGRDGALDGADGDAVVIDFSTVDPATSRSIGEACGERGIAFLDAPVSGGVAGAAAGTLTVIVGGDSAAFERARPVFDAVGGKVVHVGPAGAGSTIKLINQMLVGINLAGTIEAFVVGKLAGIEPQLLYDILSTSAGASAAMTRAVPDFFLKRNYEPGFAVQLLLKDLDLALQLGTDVQTPLYLTSVARQLYEEARAAGHAQQDITAAILPREQLHGIQI